MDWSQLPWIDIGFAIIATLYMISGYRRGFIVSVLDAVGFFSGFAGALLLYAPVASWTSARYDLARPFAKPLAFLALCLMLQFIASRLAIYLYRWVPLKIRKANFNRALGVVPGFLDAAFTATIVLSLVMALPMPAGVKKLVLASPTGSAAMRVSGTLDTAFSRVFGGAVKESLAFVTVEEGSNDNVALGFHTDGFAPDAAAESRMLDLVNAEREQRGLPPLVEDQALVKLARAHSAEMLKRGYFSHFTPEGVSPIGRATADGIDFRIIGENLALAPDVPLSHQGLMNSPGHRANILSSDYGRIGIGIQDAGVYGLMTTQDFAN